MKKIEKLKTIKFKSDARGPWVSIENREKINEIIEALEGIVVQSKIYGGKGSDPLSHKSKAGGK